MNSGYFLKLYFQAHLGQAGRTRHQRIHAPRTLFLASVHVIANTLFSPSNTLQLMIPFSEAVKTNPIDEDAANYRLNCLLKVPDNVYLGQQVKIPASLTPHPSDTEPWSGPFANVIFEGPQQTSLDESERKTRPLIREHFDLQNLPRSLEVASPDVKTTTYKPLPPRKSSQSASLQLLKTFQHHNLHSPPDLHDAGSFHRTAPVPDTRTVNKNPLVSSGFKASNILILRTDQGQFAALEKERFQKHQAKRGCRINTTEIEERTRPTSRRVPPTVITRTHFSSYD